MALFDSAILVIILIEKMMKFLLSSLLVVLFYFKTFAQSYQFSYLIKVDTSFSNVKNGVTDFENQMQSFALKSFFDSTLIKGNATRDTAILELIPKFLMQNANVNPGYRIGDKKNGITLDSAAFDNKVIHDKVNNKVITLKPHASNKVICQNVDKPYTFIKTKESKKINDWLCYKWIPRDKTIAEEVSAWICDDIPSAVTFQFISNEFKGGLVCLEFQRGFKYQLINYTKTSELKVPIIGQCDSTIMSNNNFVKQMTSKHIGLDFRMSF